MSDPRTLILSDTHLGKPGRVSVSAIRPMWDGFERVIINGDAVEMQLPDCRDAAKQAELDLRDAAEKDGVELLLIAGNHDPHISENRYHWMMDGRVLVMHGDVLHRTIVPWSCNRQAIAAMHDHTRRKATIQQWQSLEFRHELTQRLAELERQGVEAHGGKPNLTLANALAHPRKVTKVLTYWWNVPSLVDAFVKQCAPQAQCIVIGHTHHQGIWHKAGRTIINTGCYAFPGRPRAVIVEGSSLTSHRIVRQGNHYAIEDSPLFEQVFRPIVTASEPPTDVVEQGGPIAA